MVIRDHTSLSHRENFFIIRDNISHLPCGEGQPQRIHPVVWSMNPLVEVPPLTTPSAFGIDRNAAAEWILTPKVSLSTPADVSQKFIIDPGPPR